MKPKSRGYIHFGAFFIALAASILLLSKSDAHELLPNIIYCATLCGMYGVSACYHCPTWSRQNYLLIRKIDHVAIFTFIAGTATPICLIGLKEPEGLHLLLWFWGFAFLGMGIAVFWSHGPKWIRALLYVTVGWLAFPYLSEVKNALGIADMELLLMGGIIYTVGALVYAFKFPNPFPKVFGYHEIFHVMIVVASIFHFGVIYSLIS